jgi:hypothetical protein
VEELTSKMFTCMNKEIVENDIKLDLGQTGCEYGRWMELAQNIVLWEGLVFIVLNLKVSSNSNNCCCCSVCLWGSR